MFLIKKSKSRLGFKTGLLKKRKYYIAVDLVQNKLFSLYLIQNISNNFPFFNLHITFEVIHRSKLIDNAY